MNILLRRFRHEPETIDGQIWIGGRKVCDCAENTSGALPEGTYQLSLIKCRQYARKMILINPSPPCNKCPPLDYCGNNTALPVYCPMIKPGNGVFKRLDGSIIVGKYIAPGCLIHTRLAFSNLYDRIRKSAKRGHSINLIISSF